jgi:phage tail sheath protein FI
MPVNPTYPGVYVEEIPSGVRTITGVSTSITAFLGRALRGDVNEPILIHSYADFERIFGGLHVDYPLSYAVKDFYLNGGRHALIVRLYKSKTASDNDSDGGDDNPGADTGDGTGDNAGDDTGDDAGDGAVNSPDDSNNGGGASENNVESGYAVYTKDNLKLKAASPGKWGNRLSVKIDYDGINEQVLERYGLTDPIKNDHFFNLTVVEVPPNGPREIIRNVSLHPEAGSRRLDRILEQESSLIRLNGTEDDLKSGAPERPEKTEEKKDPTLRATKANEIDYFEKGEDSASLTEQDDFIGEADKKSGLNALNKADIFNLLCIPPDRRNGDVPDGVYDKAMHYCVDRRAILIVDPPAAWGNDKQSPAQKASAGLSNLNLTGPGARNAALYFPRVVQGDPLREDQLDTFVPCGIVAGVMARTDEQRGIWKAPAGLDASLNGIRGLQVNLNDDENGQLNPLGINCLRTFPIYGHVVWGARTLRGADQLADEYKYVPVRRLALYVEESLFRGLQWVVFEPNDEPLWAQIRLNVGTFLHDLFRQGAFQGSTPREAYLVKCDRETTTQSDINLGRVNIVVGFAPLKPAEFVIIKIQQLAGQLAT